VEELQCAHLGFGDPVWSSKVEGDNFWLLRDNVLLSLKFFEDAIDLILV
jgi:hypothetical protein